MNMIPKYQQGYGITPVTYTPLQRGVPTFSSEGATRASSDDSSSSEKDKDDLFSEGVIKLIAQNAISNDAKYFLNKSSLFKQSITEGLGLSGPTTQTKTKELLEYLVTMTRQKEQFEKSMAHVSDIKGQSDIAITPDGGGVYTIRNKKLAVIDVDNYNPNKDRLITNAELIEYREQSPNAAFSSGIITTINNATSKQQIEGIIKDCLTNLSSDTKSSQGYGNPHTNSQATKDLFEALNLTPERLASMPMDQIYEIKQTMKSNSRQINGALQRIVANLTQTQRTYLKVTAKQMSANSDKEISFGDLLVSMVSAVSNNEDSFSAKVMPNYNANGSVKGTTQKDMKSNNIIDFVTGIGEKEYVQLINGSDMAINTVGIKSPITKSGKPVGSQQTLLQLTNSDFAGNLDFRNASIGGYMISPSMIGQVINMDNKATAVDLPIDLQAKARGIIRPDLNAAKKFGKVQAEIKRLKLNINDNQDVQKINAIFVQNGLEPLLQSAGVLNPIKYARFVTFAGQALETALDANTNSKLNLTDPDISEQLSEVDDNKQFENIIKESDKKFKMPTKFWGNYKVFESSIFIPLSTNVLSAMHASNVNGTTAQVHQIFSDEQQLEKAKENPPKKVKSININ